MTGRPRQETCRNGHALEGNRYVWNGKIKGCLTCHREHGRKYRRRQGMKRLAARSVPVGPLMEVLNRRLLSARALGPLLADRLGIQPSSVERKVQWALTHGALTVQAADEITTALGLHPVEVWGLDWFTFAAYQEGVSDAV